MNKPGTLQDWSLVTKNGKTALTGKIYSDPTGRFKDGSSIVTGQIYTPKQLVKSGSTVATLDSSYFLGTKA